MSKQFYFKQFKLTWINFKCEKQSYFKQFSFIIKGFRTIYCDFIIKGFIIKGFIIKGFRTIYCDFQNVLADMSSGLLQVFVELGNLHETSNYVLYWIHGVTCSNSVSHNRVQALSI